MKLTKTQELLCLCLSSDSELHKKNKFIELYNSIDKSDLYKEAIQDEVFTHLAYLLRTYKLENDEVLKTSLESISKKMNIFLSELNNIGLGLKKENISVVALKNAGILIGIYKNLFCSPMGDLDLLVKKKDFYLAHEIITKKLGYKFKFRSNLEKEDIKLAYLHGGSEYYKVVDNIKVWVEIQWRPVAGRWIQENSEPDSDQLIKDSIAIKDTKVKILEPTDNLLQVCLHTAKHSYCRAPGFRLHSDVDRVVRFNKINWKVFFNKIVDLQIKTAVYYSLFFSKILLKTPIPEDVLIKLKPNFLKNKIMLGFVFNAGIFNQHKKKFSKLGYIFFNILLFDSLRNLIIGIFPNKKEIHSNNIYDRCKFNFKRISSLIFKRQRL